MTVQRVIDRVLAGLQPGEIVLMHVGSHPTDGSMLDAAALPRIVDAIRARGYTFVTLGALTG
jgi:peptidoglycan/xylan/chitin deacetylase (PgdA/CDA1 family)